MPRLLICGFESFPAAPLNPAAATVRRLEADSWRIPGVDIDFLTVPVSWTGSVEAIERHLAHRPADAVLVVGISVKADAFRVETLARNAACTISLDASDQLWPSGLVIEGGGQAVSATAPCEAIVEAVAQAGLPVESSCDAGDYLCNFTLYRLLHTDAAPSVGFLHVPQAREYDPDGAFALDQIVLAVQAAAGAFAASLAEPVLGAPR